MAGYIVQGEFGDYDVADHTPGYLDDYPFVMGKVSCNLGWAEAQLVCACVHACVCIDACVCACPYAACVDIVPHSSVHW